MFGAGGPSFWELMRQMFSSTKGGYDLLAPKFDHTPFRTPDTLLDAVFRELFGSEPPGAVLDLCCGTGAAMVRLVPYRPRRLIGLDFSPGMLAVAETQLRALDVGSWSLVEGDALAFELDEPVDWVVSFGAFGHILAQDERRFCQQIYQALRPGGRFAFVTSAVPPKTSLAWWLSTFFNMALWVRNRLPGPPFIMYYLTFTLPQVATLLGEVGFEVCLRPCELPKPFGGLQLVVATKI